MKRFPSSPAISVSSSLLDSPLSPAPIFSNRRGRIIAYSRFRSLNRFSTSSAAATKWNSTTNAIINQPALLLMVDSCNSMLQLKQIQAHLTTTSLITRTFPASRALAFCALADGGDICHAAALFARIEKPNNYMWNTMIRGWGKAKQPRVGFSLFGRMVRERAEMDARSFVFSLKVCEQFSTAFEGECVHGITWKTGFRGSLLVSTC
ncbi:unnamed protein product [Linum trigynum]|uniref:Pentatricopeptide repeat-containing protein n=1 Tax=Linum trigynum TaxID=586398 RepID=A0AAV2GAP3_9ROSI